MNHYKNIQVLNIRTVVNILPKLYNLHQIKIVL